MPALLTPARRRGEEILDRPDVDPGVVTRSLDDVAKANVLFGGIHAALAELEPFVSDLSSDATLLDVGTGVGDIPRAAAEMISRHGKHIGTIGLDAAEELARVSRDNVDDAICADALEIPLKSKSVDVVLCSQFLHHMVHADAIRLIREMNRVARARVVISDLRRSWIAVGGLWVASFPLRFHPVSRHDGVVSVLRGFTRTELTEIVREALGVPVRATRRRGFRVTTSWQPVNAR